MPKAELVRYKAKLDREVDHADISRKWGRRAVSGQLPEIAFS